MILFNYESGTCIIDADIFPPFLSISVKQEVRWSRVSEARAFLSVATRENEKARLSGRRQCLLVADVAEASGL